MAYDWFTLFKSCHLDSEIISSHCGEIFLLPENGADTKISAEKRHRGSEPLCRLCFMKLKKKSAVSHVVFKRIGIAGRERSIVTENSACIDSIYATVTVNISADFHFFALCRRDVSAGAERSIEAEDLACIGCVNNIIIVYIAHLEEHTVVALVQCKGCRQCVLIAVDLSGERRCSRAEHALEHIIIERCISVCDDQFQSGAACKCASFNARGVERNMNLCEL